MVYLEKWLVRALIYFQVIGQVYRLAFAQTKSTYTTKYDYINVDAVLKNERILKMLVDCMLERGRCTREGLELKAAVPDALRTECAKCSQMQKKHVGRVLAYLLSYRKSYWDDLSAKYDPEGVYRRKYGFTLEKLGAGNETNTNLVKPTKTIKKTITTNNNKTKTTPFKATKKRMTREEKKEMVRKRFPQLHFMPNMWASPTHIQRIEKKSVPKTIARRNVQKGAGKVG